MYTRMESCGLRKRSGTYQYWHGRQVRIRAVVSGRLLPRLGASDWLWGAKLSYNYLGATSTNSNSIIPQFGTYTTIVNPTPVPFSGPAYVRASQDQSFAGNRPDPIPRSHFRSKLRLRWRGSDHFANPDQAEWPGRVCACRWRDRGSIRRAPDFSSSSWLFGGAAMVGVTYFFTPTWFLDLNYTYAFTEGHTSNFASPFVDHSSTSVGTLVGNSAWTAQTQRIALTINKAF